MYCGHKLNRANMDADHKKSLKNGGSNTPANIQLVCRYCNRLKHTMNDKPFRRMYELDLDAKLPPARAIPYSYFDKVKANKPKIKRKNVHRVGVQKRKQNWLKLSFNQQNKGACNA